MGELLFVRHGETTWNKNGRIQGQKDTQLSNVGIIQAKKLSKRLAKRNITKIISSDLERAYQTAIITANEHNLTVQRDKRLREYSFGIWEGLTNQEIINQYPELYQDRQRDSLHTRIPQGELPQEVAARMMDFSKETINQNQDETIAVFSHGASIRLLLCDILRIDFNQKFRLLVGNTGLSIVLWEKTNNKLDFTIQTINDLAHLDN